jgi:ferredoxin-NADP reductase
MTVSLLLLCICAAIFLQVAVGIWVAVWRRRILPGPEVQSDIEQPALVTGAWPGWRKFRVAKRNFEDAGCTQCSFHLIPLDGEMLAPFKPGQFLTVRLPAADAGGELPDRNTWITRCYSLSDRPVPESYRITVKRMMAPPDRPELPPGMASAHFHDRVQENDVIEIKAPAGQFFLDAESTIPVVLICGGIGITPMMSMLRWCARAQPDRVITLFHGVRRGGEHAFKTALAELAATRRNFHINIVYSHPDPDDVQGRDFQYAGHVDIGLLRKILPLGRHDFYVCGPPAMMASLLPGLRAWGIPDEDIHFEAFGPTSAQSMLTTSPEIRLIGTDQLDIAFHRSGRTLRWDGRDANLLDFAERHGIAVESGCRSGSCGSCETKLLSGSVRYAHTPDHDIQAGSCVLCVGIPATALVLDA